MTTINSNEKKVDSLKKKKERKKGEIPTLFEWKESSTKKEIEREKKKGVKIL